MKTQLNELSVNGVTYVPKGSTPMVAGNVKIVILQRGWVMVGYYKRDGDQCTLTNASVIRQFGTTKGLGEIAKDGPTASTKLEPCNGLVEFHQLTVIAMINCEASKWLSKLT